METLIMGSWHEEPIETHDKEVTLRKGHREQFKVGEPVRLQDFENTWAFVATITGNRSTTFGEVTKQEYGDDGFLDREDMMEGMSTYPGYAEITLADDACAIRWKDAVRVK